MDSDVMVKKGAASPAIWWNKLIWTDSPTPTPQKRYKCLIFNKSDFNLKFQYYLAACFSAQGGIQIPPDLLSLPLPAHCVTFCLRFRVGQLNAPYCLGMGYDTVKVTSLLSYPDPCTSAKVAMTEVLPSLWFRVLGLWECETTKKKKKISPCLRKNIK